MAQNNNDSELMTTGGHLEVLRKMLFRIILVILVLAIIIFCFKKETFALLLAPKSSDFATFTFIDAILAKFNIQSHFSDIDVSLISTELSSQFMTHIYVSCLLATLFASPYILFEIFRFVSPALYESEKKYSVAVACTIYVLFFIGVLISYFILFPISFRFLATYQVDESVVNTITLDSYISTFSTLVFLTGILFQLPIIIFVLGKMELVNASMLKKFRPYALVVIMIVAAIITPPDIFTLFLVTVPIYGLYELSILVLKKTNKG